MATSRERVVTVDVSLAKLNAAPLDCGDSPENMTVGAIVKTPPDINAKRLAGVPIAISTGGKAKVGK